jgi:4-hydroxybenzoyl-CoA thioesterase
MQIEVPMRIEWGDCDPAGIVFYPRYFGYFNICTEALFERCLGMKKPDWTRKHGIIGIPMVDTRAKFSRPAHHGDDVVVVSRFGEVRGSSFDVVHRLMHGDQLGVEGFETRVWTGADPNHAGRMRSVRIPDDVRLAMTS